MAAAEPVRLGIRVVYDYLINEYRTIIGGKTAKEEM
jgi:hypothetical protein